MDLTNKTQDELNHLAEEIKKEVERRREEPVMTCFVYEVNSYQYFFKDFNSAIKAILDDLDEFNIKELFAKLSVYAVDIPKTEYNNRPDEWYKE